jgi:hypothetical protein
MVVVVEKSQVALLNTLSGNHMGQWGHLREDMDLWICAILLFVLCGGHAHSFGVAAQGTSITASKEGKHQNVTGLLHSSNLKDVKQDLWTAWYAGVKDGWDDGYHPGNSVF